MKSNRYFLEVCEMNLFRKKMYLFTDTSNIPIFGKARRWDESISENEGDFYIMKATGA